MERAVRLYRRESRKQMELWLPAIAKACNGEFDETYTENNHNKIWLWGLNRWGMDFSYLECEIRQNEGS